MNVESQYFDKFDNLCVQLLVVNFEMPRLDVNLPNFVLKLIRLFVRFTFIN